MERKTSFWVSALCEAPPRSPLAGQRWHPNFLRRRGVNWCCLGCGEWGAWVWGRELTSRAFDLRFKRSRLRLTRAGAFYWEVGLGQRLGGLERCRSPVVWVGESHMAPWEECHALTSRLLSFLETAL